MLSNPLPALLETYKITEDSFKIAKRAIKTKNPKERPRLLQRTDISVHPVDTAERLIEKSQKEAEDLFVLAMWVAFERFVRTYLLEKGQTLKKTIFPTPLGDSMYRHFRQQIEYWRPEELLDALQEGLFQSESNKHLIGNAKGLLKHRNWLAHKNPDNKPVDKIPHPQSAYDTLNAIINVLLLNR
ncbi:hypothetical protein BGP_4745 [Beggiatoa sp. PS]|nr:hypothetical protein BGP_4745 [Beggiatoa sp. PS]